MPSGRVMRRTLTPTHLLVSSAALFVSPALFVLATSLLIKQGSLDGVTLPGTVQAVIWATGGASLIAPFAFRRLLGSSEPVRQLLLTITATDAAPFFGVVLSLTTGSLTPVVVLSVAAMLGILLWSYAYRECFRTEPLEYAAPRYTVVLFLLGVIYLAFAAYRAARWNHVAPSSIHSAMTGFMIVINFTVGAAAIATASMRRMGSAFARSATHALSWCLLPIPVLGTLTSLYWMFAVRRREQVPSSAPAV